ncbi:unnamed protein product, partial [Ascophyllum nodosum]
MWYRLILCLLRTARFPTFCAVLWASVRRALLQLFFPPWHYPCARQHLSHKTEYGRACRPAQQSPKLSPLLAREYTRSGCSFQHPFMLRVVATLVLISGGCNPATSSAVIKHVGPLLNPPRESRNYCTSSPC